MSQNKAYCSICDWEFPIKEVQTCEICKQSGMCVKCYDSHECVEEGASVDRADLDDDDLPDVGIAYTDEDDDEDEDW